MIFRFCGCNEWHDGSSSLFLVAGALLKKKIVFWPNVGRNQKHLSLAKCDVS